MVLDKPYNNLEETLEFLKIQVRDSLDFAHEFVPQDIHTPSQLFYWLKPQLTYKKDPVEYINGKKESIEYIQTLQILINKNDGHGDCDCFTVAALACGYILNFRPLYVDLVGKTMFSPTHIYTETYDPDRGKICALDFTNPIYNMQRSYNFKQRVLFRL